MDSEKFFRKYEELSDFERLTTAIPYSAVPFTFDFLLKMAQIASFTEEGITYLNVNNEIVLASDIIEELRSMGVQSELVYGEDLPSLFFPDRIKTNIFNDIDIVSVSEHFSNNLMKSMATGELNFLKRHSLKIS